MLRRIAELIVSAFGAMLDRMLVEETAARLTAHHDRVKAALAAGDVTAEALGGVPVAPAVADKPKRRAGK